MFDIPDLPCNFSLRSEGARAKLRKCKWKHLCIGACMFWRASVELTEHVASLFLWKLHACKPKNKGTINKNYRENSTAHFPI